MESTKGPKTLLSGNSLSCFGTRFFGITQSSDSSYSTKLATQLTDVFNCIYNYNISFIIHEEKTKEISGMTVVVYLKQNSADLH